jgi:glutaredoxin
MPLLHPAWCPYCTAQLRAFERAGDSFAQVGTS